MMPATSVYSAPKDDDQNGISWNPLNSIQLHFPTNNLSSSGKKSQGESFKSLSFPGVVSPVSFFFFVSLLVSLIWHSPPILLLKTLCTLHFLQEKSLYGKVYKNNGRDRERHRKRERERLTSSGHMNLWFTLWIIVCNSIPSALLLSLVFFKRHYFLIFRIKEIQRWKRKGKKQERNSE